MAEMLCGAQAMIDQPLPQGGIAQQAEDSRGHGRSSRNAQPYGYDLMSDDVIGLLDYLKNRDVARYQAIIEKLGLRR